MSDLEALLAGIVADPHNAVRWLIVADWLDDHGQHDHAELLRLHRMLLETCCEPDQHPERAEWHARIMELMRAGARPCIPQQTLMLPGGVPLAMSFIPPGSFLMGSPDSEADREPDEALHQVTLTKGFFLGIHPVTQAQWTAVMGDNPSRFKGDTLPVETVSWDDAQTFCARVRQLAGVEARLPTEAEWEYACRGGTSTPFCWGTELNGTQANCRGNYPHGTEAKGPYLKTTTAVGSYAGVSPHPWGLADVIGNVWEWCGDWYAACPDGDVVDPAGPESGSIRVVRGVCWFDDARFCRAAHRYRNRPDNRRSFLGFRLAVDPFGQ